MRTFVQQLSDDEVMAVPGPESNSIEVIVKHVGGNLASRCTDFLTTDGEKPWRQRDEEFYTLNLNSITSPSATTYSLPSMR